MASQPDCRHFFELFEWECEWNKDPIDRFRFDDSGMRRVAAGVERLLGGSGFCLFRNGGRPLLERRSGEMREEIVFIPAPKMEWRGDLPFTVQVHLSSKAIARIRSRFWRPAIRAPESIASGNVGLFGRLPTHCLFSAVHPNRCADALCTMLEEDVLPWFDLLHSPLALRRRLYAGAVQLITESTATELLLAEFGPAEARRFIQRRELIAQDEPGPISELEGYDLESDRLAPIRAYYQL